MLPCPSTAALVLHPDLLPRTQSLGYTGGSGVAGTPLASHPCLPAAPTWSTQAGLWALRRPCTPHAAPQGAIAPRCVPQVPDLLSREEDQRRRWPQARVFPRDPSPHRPLNVPHVARQERAAEGEAGHEPPAPRGWPGLQPAGEGHSPQGPGAGWGAVCVTALTAPTSLFRGTTT